MNYSAQILISDTVEEIKRRR